MIFSVPPGTWSWNYWGCQDSVGLRLDEPAVFVCVCSIINAQSTKQSIKPKLCDSLKKLFWFSWSSRFHKGAFCIWIQLRQRIPDATLIIAQFTSQVNSFGHFRSLFCFRSATNCLVHILCRGGAFSHKIMIAGAEKACFDAVLREILCFFDNFRWRCLRNF